MTDRTSSGYHGPLRPRPGGRAAGSSRSRIERFATLIEETGTGRHHRRPIDADGEVQALVALTHQLADVTQPTVSAQFREDLRARLAAAYLRERQPAPEPARNPANEETQVVRQVRPRFGGRARLAAVIGIASGALALSGVSLASNDAVPGDPLYGVKGFSEQAQLVFAGSDANRGHLHLDFARSRLVEARQVAPAAVAGVLAAMDQEITEGVRLLFTSAMESRDVAPVDAVVAFVAQQRADLLELRATVRAPEEPTRRSLDLLNDIEIRANQLRAALADNCAVTETDQLGPKPVC